MSRRTPVARAAAPPVAGPPAAPARPAAPLSVHIERLVLDGLPLARGAGARVQSALAAELGRLLGGTPLRGDLRSGAALASLRLPALTLEAGIEPEQLGEQLARALFRGLVP